MCLSRAVIIACPVPETARTSGSLYELTPNRTAGRRSWGLVKSRRTRGLSDNPVINPNRTLSSACPF